MTKLGNTIAGNAIDWLSKQCFEQSFNRGTCIDAIHEQYDPTWIERHTNEAYCAEFVSIVLQKSFTEYGQDSPIYTASAVGVLNTAKSTGILVDTTPAVGAVFYKKSSAAGSSGHVGIIVENIDGNYFNTVEGNATDPATGKEGVVSIKRSIRSDSSIRVIHTEKLLGENQVMIAGASKPMLFVTVAVALGLVWQYRNSIFKQHA